MTWTTGFYHSQQLGTLQFFSTPLGEQYLSLNDIARNYSANATSLIDYWIGEPETIRFLTAWEEAHNTFYRNTLPLHTKTTRQWITAQNARGIVITPKENRLFAQAEIALKFASWLSEPCEAYIDALLRTQTGGGTQPLY